jgi:hypothetical protein
MRSTSWIESRRHHLGNMDQAFKQHDVRIATYGMRQSRQPRVTATTDPWTYLPIFCNVTCRPDTDGRSSFNYAFIDDLRRIQNGDLD